MEHRGDVSEFEAFNRSPSISLSVLKQRPYGSRCRVCREAFRSKRARDGYCGSCRRIIDDRTRGLDAILAAAEIANFETQQQAIEEVKLALTCNFPVEGGFTCGWRGTAARLWPKTISGLRETLRDFVERDQRHEWQHLSPGRFGAPALRREKKRLIDACNLPEEYQPEWVKLHLRSVRWLKSQGLTPRVSWPGEGEKPKLLRNRKQRSRSTPRTARQVCETLEEAAR
jgi:hypothetical protein